MPEISSEVALIYRHALQTGAALRGPLLLTEPSAPSWIKPGWTVTPDKWDNLLLHRPTDDYCPV
jgi:hypothetical protein